MLAADLRSDLSVRLKRKPIVVFLMKPQAILEKVEQVFGSRSVVAPSPDQRDAAFLRGDVLKRLIKTHASFVQFGKRRKIVQNHGVCRFGYSGASANPSMPSSVRC